MHIIFQAKTFIFVLLSIFLTMGATQGLAQEKPKPEDKNLKVVNLEELKPKDSTKKYLEAIVKYKAKDYNEFDNKKKLITLYNEAELFYQDYELKAGIIVFDYKKNEVYAGRIKDSLGEYIQYPVFKQGNNVVEPDSIRFNFKTKKAKVWNSRTKQDELFVNAAISKKENDSTYFMKHVKMTTAEDIDDPEYYFLAQKAKFVPGKKVVVGFTNMWLANIPTPIALPFAFFPFTNTRRSGVLLPSYGQNNNRGYALQNGGYYFALSDNYDLAVMGDYFTNGSYSLRGESQYAKKYKYSGNVQIRYENQINSERGLPDYSKSKIFNIQWSHSKDSKSNPNSRFSASVNAGSSQYYNQSISQNNMGSNLNNTLNSSISYQTTLKTVPQVSLSFANTLSQNTRTHNLVLNLPTFQASADRVFLFAKKDENKKGFIKNLNVQYSLNGQNVINIEDTLLFKSKFNDIAKIGFQHNIPISTNYKVFKYFSATTSVNYKEVWQLKTINKKFDATQGDVVTTYNNGLDGFRTYSFGNSLSTTIYGTYDFKGNGKMKSLRHTIKPSVGHSYVPGNNRHKETYVKNINGDTVEYTRFDDGLFGNPNTTYSNVLSFGVTNDFEAKVKDSDTTKTELKKIKLLNNLSFGSSFDLKTSRWSTISFSGGTAVLKEKMQINFNGSIDPYIFAEDNYRRNAFAVSNANITMNYSLSARGKKEKTNDQGKKNGGREDDLFGTNKDLNDENNLKKQEENQNEFAGFYNAEIPFDLNMALSATYSNNENGSKISSCSLMVSSNIDLTPKWKFGVSSGYDFVNKGVTYTQLRMNRDLMSWYMNFNWAPFGSNAQWGFYIGIKAGVFSDIKWDKRNLPDRTLR